MKRQLLIFVIALAALAGSLVAAWATARARNTDLRGYVDATQDAALPFRIPRFGVNAELTQYTSDQLDAEITRMQQAQITWVRQFARWDEIEPQRGSYDWSKWDVIIAALGQHPDLKLVAVLMNTPRGRVPPAALIRSPRRLLILPTSPVSPTTSRRITAQPSTSINSGTSQT